MKVSLECLTDGYFDHILPDDGRIAKFRAALKQRMGDIAKRWMGESQKNAPIGPTKGLLKELHRGGGTTTTKGTRVKPGATVKLTRFYSMSAAALASKKKGTLSGPAGGLGERLTSWKNPGGLVRSIECESDEEHAAVFVASNAEAGEYAHIIHDMKGVKWHERGPGTQAKGDRADEKFIERAQPDAVQKLNDYLAKSLKELFGG